MKNKIVSSKSITGHRPYTALLYLGYVRIPESVYSKTTINVRGDDKSIHAMYSAGDGFLIIYK